MELDKLLTKGGLFVIHMSQYDLPDTCAANRYRPWGNCTQAVYGPWFFGPDSKLKTSTAPPAQYFCEGKITRSVKRITLQVPFRILKTL